MSNINMVRNFKSTAGAIAAFTIVKPGASDGLVIPAAASTDKLLGVTTDIAAATGDRCDVIIGGIADVLYGGTVAAGDLLTADSSGRAITATGTAGTNYRLIGFALIAGVVGDIGQCAIKQSSFQG
jgi:hypothetical protein